MIRNLFPLQITKRIYLTSLFLLIIPVIIITLVIEYQYFRHEMMSREKTLFSVTRKLNREMHGTFIDLLRRENALNKPRQEQIQTLNAILQPEVDALVEAYPGMGMGYYSRELDSRVALGPNFSHDKLVGIPPSSPYMDIYRTGKSIARITRSHLIWKDEPILAVATPIYRDNKLIGHIFANIKLKNLYSGILAETAVIILTGFFIAVLNCRIAWWFLQKLSKELEMFSVAVIEGNSCEIPQILPELNPIINLVCRRTAELQSVIVRLRAEVSMREAVEREVLAANEKTNRILESMTDAFYALDKDWKITYVNGEAERQGSTDRDILLGKDIRKLYPEAEELFEMLSKAVSQQKTIHFQTSTDKTGKWYEVTAYPSKEGLGVYFRDVSARKNAEEQIVFQANLLENVRNAVIATDIEGKVTYWNSYAEKLYGWKAEEIVDKNVSLLSVKPENLRINGPIAKASLVNKGYWEGDLEVVRKDGTTVPMHRIVTLIKNSDGNPIGIISVGVDLTERKKLEREMARLDRLHMVGEMAAGIGHEVRNPMTTVRGFIQLLSAKEDSSIRREQFNLMIGELDRANSIITEYLSLAKNKMVELNPRCLNTVIKHLFPLLQADAMVSDKYIKTELRNIPELLLNEKEISQLVINLVRNGLEAMKPGGTVILKTYMDGGSVVLEVNDEGNGIDPGIVERIGTPFVTTKETGTGLGLAVSYSIADRHNARIDFETGKEGTSFYVNFDNAVSTPGELCYTNAV